MDVRFVPPDLRMLDALKSEALCVPFFEDERPLRGALGLVDWRMCGLISRLLLRGRVSGAAGEKLLIPARPKLSFDKLILFGLGPTERFDGHAFDRTVRAVLDTMTGARVRAAVCVLPGRALSLVEPAEAMERFLRVAGTDGEQDEVTLVEDAEAQKVMASIIERARARVRAPV